MYIPAIVLILIALFVDIRLLIVGGIGFAIFALLGGFI